MSESMYILCIHLRDDQTRVDALKDAIADGHDPEILRVVPHDKFGEGGQWVSSMLMDLDEINAAQKHPDKRWYDDDGDFWAWIPDEIHAEFARMKALNEDKHRTIQAYCKAASEDKARIKELEDRFEPPTKRPCESCGTITDQHHPPMPCSHSWDAHGGDVRESTSYPVSISCRSFSRHLSGPLPCNVQGYDPVMRFRGRFPHMISRLCGVHLQSNS